MKKMILVLAAMAIAVCANAQIYLGGSMHFQASDNIDANFTIKPEVGYSFNDSMAVGASLGIGFFSQLPSSPSPLTSDGPSFISVPQACSLTADSTWEG